MNLEEFSDGFDTLASSYRRFKDFDNKENLDSIEFNEFEKSYFLTEAQKKLVITMYNGKNTMGDTFEGTEEIRRYLDILVETKKYSETELGIEASKSLSDKSRLIKLPSNLMFIIYESITLDDDTLGCYSGKTINVQPTTHDEYNKVKENPFRGATRYKALRLDTQLDDGQYVEIISRYSFSTYTLRYIREPKPIILVDLPNNLTIEGKGNKSECELNSALHQQILEEAVREAMASKVPTAQS